MLARHAPAVTTALDAAAGELAELRGLRAGRVRLVAFPSASPTVVPRLLADLAAQHPGHRDHLRRGRAARGRRGGARGPRRHRADLQLPGRPRRPARPERGGSPCARSAPTICSPCCRTGTRPRRRAGRRRGRSPTRTGSPDARAAAATCSSCAVAPASSRGSRSRPTTSSRSRGSSRRASAWRRCRAWPSSRSRCCPGVDHRARCRAAEARHDPRRHGARRRARAGGAQPTLAALARARRGIAALTRTATGRAASAN